MSKYLSYDEAAEAAIVHEKWFGLPVRVVCLPDGYWGLQTDESHYGFGKVWILG